MISEERKKFLTTTPASTLAELVRTGDIDQEEFDFIMGGYKSVCEDVKLTSPKGQNGEDNEEK